MSVKIGEIGKGIYLGTGSDLDLNDAPFTALAIKFTSPDGIVTFTRTNPDVTAPAVDSPSLENVGILPANNYMLYLTQDGDFDLGGAGEWTVCTEYEDAAPSKFMGDDTTITIEEGCD